MEKEEEGKLELEEKEKEDELEVEKKVECLPNESGGLPSDLDF